MTLYERSPVAAVIMGGPENEKFVLSEKKIS